MRAVGIDGAINQSKIVVSSIAIVVSSISSEIPLQGLTDDGRIIISKTALTDQLYLTDILVSLL